MERPQCVVCGEALSNELKNQLIGQTSPNKAFSASGLVKRICAKKRFSRDNVLTAEK